MKKKLEDYVLTAQSALPIKLCKDTIKEINKNQVYRIMKDKIK